MTLPLLAACASEPAAPSAASWIGRSEADLVQSLGVPDRVHDADGRRFLAYDGAGAAAPSLAPSFGFGTRRSTGSWGSLSTFGTGVSITLSPSSPNAPCTTSYEIRDGRVIGAARQGPGCG